MNSLQIEYVPVSVPRPDPRNTRTHSQRQIRQVAESIEQFGFVNPILIDEADRIIAGLTTSSNAKSLGTERRTMAV